MFSMINVVIICSLVIMIVLGGCGNNDKKYTVNGTVTLGGTGLIGVTVTLAGNASATAITDASGNYTVTPSL